MTDKIQPRVLRAGIYTEAGELISDSHDLTFDLNSDNPRERELQVRFVLTRKADEANGQEVILRLEETYRDFTLQGIQVAPVLDAALIYQRLRLLKGRVIDERT